MPLHFLLLEVTVKKFAISTPLLISSPEGSFLSLSEYSDA